MVHPLHRGLQRPHVHAGAGPLPLVLQPLRHRVCEQVPRLAVPARPGRGGGGRRGGGMRGSTEGRGENVAKQPAEPREARPRLGGGGRIARPHEGVRRVLEDGFVGGAQWGGWVREGMKGKNGILALLDLVALP